MRLLYASVASLVGVFLLLFPIYGSSSSSGVVPGYSGGPADAGTCHTCHAEFEVNEGTGSVEIQGPKVYEPGQVYTLAVVLDNTTEPVGDDPVQGFQLSVQDADGNHIGELVITDAVNTRFSFGDPVYVTHTTAGRFVDTWEMQWIAPAEEVAPDLVTVYVAANAADGNGNVSGDYVYTAAAAIARKSSSAPPPAVAGAFVLRSLFPNPARDATRKELEMERELPTRVVVHDGLGREVSSVDFGSLVPGAHVLPLALDGLSSGMYFARIVTPDGELVRAFTVVQ